MVKYDFYAFRRYKNKKRLEEWTLRKGEYPTGRGIMLTTGELENIEKNFKVKRVSKKWKKN